MTAIIIICVMQYSIIIMIDDGDWLFNGLTYSGIDIAVMTSIDAVWRPYWRLLLVTYCWRLSRDISDDDEMVKALVTWYAYCYYY